jgi:uncharacterized protein YlaI
MVAPTSIAKQFSIGATLLTFRFRPAFRLLQSPPYNKCDKGRDGADKESNPPTCEWQTQQRQPSQAATHLEYTQQDVDECCRTVADGGERLQQPQHVRSRPVRHHLCNECHTDCEFSSYTQTSQEAVQRIIQNPVAKMEMPVNTE